MGKLSMALRKQSATIKQQQGGRTRYRFPINDQEHARKALQMLPRAKGMSPADKARVKARAHRMLGGQ